MTKIKICGIRTLYDALAAIDAGADMLGFNFYKKSVRYVDVGMCRSITSALRTRSHTRLVGVFVNASAAEIRATMQTCGLNLVQLHGDETPEMLDAFNGKAFKAIRLSASSVEESVSKSAHPLLSVDESVSPFLKSVDPIRYPLQKSALKPALLVDAAVKGVYGGSGENADWSAAAELARKYPLLLAGGLTPENVSDAVRQVKPWGVDVASGVETTPGKKDAAKMKAFVQAVRDVENQSQA